MPAPYTPNPVPPPQPSSNRALWWAGGVAVLLVVVLAVVAAVLVLRDDPSGEAPSARTGGSTAPRSGTGCGTPGANATTPITDRVVAGPVSFPVSAAPGWVPMGYATFAESSLAQGLKQALPGQSWQAHVEIGLTNFGQRVSSSEAARRMIPCIVAGFGYNRSPARIEGLTEPEAVTVDGVRAYRATARVLVTKSGLTIPGDVVTVVVIDSAPQAYFESDTPIGDTAYAAVARQVFEQLKVARDV